jgi:hypothetical protein
MMSTKSQLTRYSPTLNFQAVFLTKRAKIVLLTVIMTISLGLVYLLAAGGLVAIAAWLVAAYIGVILALWDDLKMEEYVVLPLYPVLWSVAAMSWVVALQPQNYFLVGLCAVYAAVFYALVLAVNILSVVPVRTMPLVRTALTVMHVTGLLCAFLLLYVSQIRQLYMETWLLTVAGIAFLLAWPLLWASQETGKRLQLSLQWALFVSLIIVQCAAASALWPGSFLTSLFLATIIFVVIGVLYYEERRLLTRELQRQYAMLALMITVLYAVMTRWGG